MVSRMAHAAEASLGQRSPNVSIAVLEGHSLRGALVHQLTRRVVGALLSATDLR